MKTTLTFDLPEEREDLEYAMNGVKYSVVLSEFDQFLRSKIKYETLSEVEYAIYSSIRDKLYEVANENEVSI